MQLVQLVPLLAIIGLLPSPAAAFQSVLELDADNFDQALASHPELLVHFYATWSKRCEAFRPVLLEIATSGGRVVHAQSDINDPRGYTSYIERHGATRLPTLVYFRQGQPRVYPSDHSLDASSVAAWLEAVSSAPAEISISAEGGQLEAQLEAHHERLRVLQLEAMAGPSTTGESGGGASAGGESGGGASAGGESGGGDGTYEAGGGDETDEMGELGGSGDGAGVGAGAGGAGAGVGGAGAAAVAADGADGGAAVAADGAGGGAAVGSADGGCMRGDPLVDADFEKRVFDKAVDVFVIFYQPNAAFCAAAGVAYATFASQLQDSSPTVKALHMDVTSQKSPFVFSEDELPVVMLFPAMDKRPLEFSDDVTLDALTAFARQHSKTLADERS